MASDDHPASWEDMLRALLGEEGAREAIEHMRGTGMDPEELSKWAGMPRDPAEFNQLMEQLRAMLKAGDEGPADWQLAREMARQQLLGAGELRPTAAQDTRARQQLQVADLWLDAVTDLTGTVERRGALSRTQWVEEVMPSFQQLAFPVAANVTRAVNDLIVSQKGWEDREAVNVPGMEWLGMEDLNLLDLVRRLAGKTFGMQIGVAVASLAKEAFGLTDLGVLLSDSPRVALVSQNVDGWAGSLDIPADEISQFLAVRELAVARLYAASPWLRGHVLGLVQNYAREISLDLAAMEESFRAINPTDADDLREALSSGIFAPAVTDAQKQTLESLETTLAVIEGWVEHVTAEATRGMLPNYVALGEMMRRRRATGGPAEETFRNLVGLELRPRRCHEATRLWAALGAQLGPAERDALWSHPDLMPSSAELDDPTSLVISRAVGSDFDDALTSLLREAAAGDGPDGGEEEGPAAGAGPGVDEGPAPA